MTKGSKPVIVVMILLLIMSALTVLAYVGIKKKCEVLTRDKVLAEKDLNLGKNRRITLVAQLQMLTAEERITTVAMNELGMKKRTDPAIEYKVDKDKIERIEKVLKEKYE